jgi:ABC-2 type transport system permease protein
MITDIITVIWKEWHELLLSKSARKTNWSNVLIFAGIVGLWFPLLSGPAWFTGWGTIFTSCFPLMVVPMLMADSIAGERERHTLETLLASRLPDRAILLGKIGAAVGYGWGIALLSQPLAVLALNLFQGHGQFLFYTPPILLAILVYIPVAGVLLAAGAVLFSLGAATVKEASQRTVLPFLLLIAPFSLIPIALPYLPPDWRAGLLALDGGQIALALVGILIVADVALLLSAVARFQRARLAVG